jgi:hypothetical protein
MAEESKKTREKRKAKIGVKEASRITINNQLGQNGIKGLEMILRKR